MVNPKRVEQKIPLLISNGPSFSWEYEEKEYLTRKLKRNEPSEYNFHINGILDHLNALEQKALLQKRKHNGDGHR
jgi:uncharacterized membrane protein YkgB